MVSTVSFGSGCELIDKFGLSGKVQHVAVNFMCCFNNIEHFVKEMLGPKYGKLSNIPNLDAN
jgi:hypothetical protein